MLAWCPSPQCPTALVCNVFLLNWSKIFCHHLLSHAHFRYCPSHLLRILLLCACSRLYREVRITQLRPCAFILLTWPWGRVMLYTNSSTESSGHILGYLCISVTWKICSKQGLKSISPKSKVSRLVISFQPSVQQQSISEFVLFFSRRN